MHEGLGARQRGATSAGQVGHGIQATGQRPPKPLGRKSYGSIPHLPNSRVGPADWHISEGQAAIACQSLRDGADRVIVTEKLDGSNVGIARIGDAVVPLIRAGYHASDSLHEQHGLFVRWVAARERRFLGLLADGERVAGEWLIQAHGTRYDLRTSDDLFVAFDILGGHKHKRVAFDALTSRCREHDVAMAATISDGPPLATMAAMDLLGERGFHGAVDGVEGGVWRVEREGRFDFIAKYVRPEKRDGCLLPEESGEGAIWNWPLEAV